MDFGNNNEDILIKGVNAGEERAFEAVFHQYYATLCYFANKFVRDEEVARDIVQDVFIRFYEKSVNFPNLIALKSFLYSCVQNRALNYLEKMNNRAAIRQKMEQATYDEPEYFHRQLEAELFEEIFAAIDELPTECRRIFKMSYVDNMDICEISEQLNISESTIKTQRQRAKKYLRERLQNLCPLAFLLFF